MLRRLKRLRIVLAIREINNYVYILRTIRRESKNPTWQSFDLRYDWVGRIYTVLNLRKEDIGEDELIKRTRLLEKMQPINKYLRSLDMHEIVYPSLEKKSEQSYLLVYSPLFKSLTVLYIIKILFIIGIIIAALIYFI